ncbi:MAG: hypothetical protein MUP36_03625 [Demequinaceae bacterium]|nr:hypothetical protein [Demequinaceae bacterium]
MASLRIALAASTLAIAACSTAQVDIDLPESPLALNDWVEGDDSMAALLEGTLAIHSGCLVVVPDELGDAIIVAFPRSLVEWDASTGVLTYGGVEYRIGDHVSMGGGGLETNASIDMPEACVALNQPYVFFLMDTTLEPWTPPE